MKIYTRTGDAGQTGIIGGRVDKDDPRVEACGTVDELNSLIGQAAAGMKDARFIDMKRDLLQIQHELFDCGADLAHAHEPSQGWNISADITDRVETWIDRYDEELTDITRFILPGGSIAGAALHVCRAVCRRAERKVVTLSKMREANPEVKRYLNRLSDLLFTMARAANVRTGEADIEYIRGSEVFRNRDGQ